MKAKYLLTSLFLLVAATVASAQIDPPSLLCLRNDSLFWDNVPNNCGPYVGTSVFRADNANGPFTEIAQINDQTATSFLDPNPMGQLRYYYLAYDFACPGEPISNSDTLNNLIPLPPTAIWLSVEDSTVVVNWTMSNSPQTSGYRIFRREPQGLVAVGMVNGMETTSFVDNSFTSQPVSEAYAVAAIDACGTQSLLTSEATNVEAVSPLLTLSGGNGCVSVITLTTDAPAVSSIPLPINAWRMLASINGGPFTEVGSFGGGDSFTYDQANDGENICFYLEGSVQNNAGRPLRTPIQCVNVSITQPVRTFRLLGGGFDASDNFCFDFEWDAQAEVDLLEANLIDAGSQSAATSLVFNSLTDPLAESCLSPTEQPVAPYSINLRAEDVCDNIVITNTLNPVFLSGETPQNGTNTLSWTSFTNEQDVNVSYRLERTAFDGTTETIYTGPDNNFSEQIEATDVNLALSCYRVFTTVDFADGSFSNTYASQTVCLEQQPMIYVPNAFSPNATQVLNREFCPGFARMPTGDYQMDIWDRWGGHLFTTTEAGDCWEGDARGIAVEAGVYLYVIRLTIGNRIIERKGAVTLLR